MAATTDSTDLYGFPIKVLPTQVKERAECDAAMEREQANWMPFIEKERLPNNESKTKDMIRKGVPPTLRTWVWMETSGAGKKKASHAENYYQIMLKASVNSPYLEEIEQDCPRTFPEHVWIASPDGQAALKRVLQAYSVHNDRVGYCRAMNCIVATLLVAMNRNEEAAFWLLASLVEDILYQGTYARHLEGCQVEMKALDELIAQKLPRLHAHFQTLELDISIIATDWYLCLFCTSLPSETVMRVWDALFAEGPKIVFRVSLALFKIYEENILKVDNAGELMMRMRNAAATMHQRDVLMSVAFEGIGSLPMAIIDKYRVIKQQEVEAALQTRGVRAELANTSSSKPSAVDQMKVMGTEGTKVAMDGMKVGLGKFMVGFNKLADKTAEKLAKMSTKDGQQPGVSTGTAHDSALSATAPVNATAVPPAGYGAPPHAAAAAPQYVSSAPMPMPAQMRSAPPAPGSYGGLPVGGGAAGAGPASYALPQAHFDEEEAADWKHSGGGAAPYSHPPVSAPQGQHFNTAPQQAPPPHSNNPFA